MLSVTHFIADYRLNRPLVPAFEHQHQALRLLQQSIHDLEITEAVAISVSMLVWINSTQMNPSAVDQHLRGLYLILQQLGSKSDVRNAVTNPLLPQLWRIAIRLANTATVLFFPLTFELPPVDKEQIDIDRQWINVTHPGETGEWLFASFAIDNLMRSACHVASQAWELRQSKGKDAESQIKIWVAALLQEHEQWSQLKIVLEADRLEKSLNAEPLNIDTAHTFLDYAPLRICNPIYRNMLNCWHAIYIWIDLIASPNIGPGSKSSTRFRYAVEISRTYAALGKGAMLTPSAGYTFLMTGVAFGGKRNSPREVQWLFENAIQEVTGSVPVNVPAAVHPLDL